MLDYDGPIKILQYLNGPAMLSFWANKCSITAKAISP
jgi:hypothetical protein